MKVLKLLDFRIDIILILNIFLQFQKHVGLVSIGVSYLMVKHEVVSYLNELFHLLI